MNPADQRHADASEASGLRPVVYPWDRLTYPDPMAVGHESHGWVASPGPWQHPEVKPLSGRRESGTVVILGERGVGKSHLLLAEYETLRTAGASCKHVPLPEVSFGRLAERITDAFAGAAYGMHYAFLDALDDTTHPADTANMIAEALNLLGESERLALRLRLTCRPSRWSPGLQLRLEQLHPGRVQIVGVAGLTRDQALKAAAVRGIRDPERFVAELESRRLVVPVAMWPITYVQALEDAAAGRSLPKTALDAYHRTCIRLCSEALPGSKTPDGRLDPREVLALGRKAAAAMQFSGHHILAEGTDEDAISLDDLAQDTEPLGDRSVPCNHSGFQQLIGSGLMVPVGHSRRWAFAHRSFEEYLAADYLLTRSTTPASVARLLLVGEGPYSRAITMHRDVAAWVATSDDVLFEHLLIHDPAVLLHADLRSRSEADRARVFDTLLDRVRAGDDPVKDPSLLANLDGPVLINRLQPLLDAHTPVAELYLALRVALHCPHPELTDQLLGIAETTGVPKPLRIRALVAVHRDINSSDWLARLRTVAGDPDPDVAAAALRNLWPGHMDTADLLDALPIPLPDYLGMATYLLHYLVNEIPEADMVAAVRWAARALTEDATPQNYNAFQTWNDTAQAIIIRAIPMCLTHPDSEALVDALADAALALAGQAAMHGISSNVQHLLREDAAARRAIARAVLDRATSAQVLGLYHVDGVCLFFMAEDAGYWARELPGLPPQVQALFHEQMWFIGDAFPEWEEVYELVQKYPDTKELTRSLFQWPIDHCNREHHRARRAAATEAAARRHLLRSDATALQAAVEAVLASTDDPRDAWREVLRHLYRTPNGDQWLVAEQLETDRAPSFPATGSTLHRQIMLAARKVLESAPIVTADDVRPGNLHPLGDVPELCALALCLTPGREAPALEAVRWGGLALALFCVHGTDLNRDHRDVLLATCAERANGEFETVLPAALSRLGDTWREVLLRTLRQPLSQACNQAMLDWAVQRERTLEDWRQMLEVLAGWQDQPALDALRRATAVASARLDDPASRTSRRWVAAADILIRQARTETWPIIFRRLERQPHLIGVLLRSLAADDASGFWHGDPRTLSSTDLGPLYTLLVEHGPEYGTFNGPELYSDAEVNLLRLRRRLPSIMADQADTTALTALVELQQRHSDDLIVREAVLRAQDRVIQQAWQPLASVREVVTIATHRTERVVTDEIHLRDAVIESLDRLQSRIGDDNGWATVLWDVRYTTKTVNGKRRSHTEWNPKREQDLNDFVATFLRYDLQDRRVIVNREVEITRNDLPGDRTDIQVHAHMPGRGSSPETLTVIIESKRCSNPELATGLIHQLVDRYLRRQGSRAGVYLVGFFDDHRWDGRRKHASHDIGDILAEQQLLADQAAEEYGVSVKVKVLDCRLRGNHSRTPRSEP